MAPLCSYILTQNRLTSSLHSLLHIGFHLILLAPGDSTGPKALISLHLLAIEANGGNDGHRYMNI